MRGDGAPQNFLASVSDMMAGLLFIVMIVLMGFVYQALVLKENLTDLATDNAKAREVILREIWDKLDNKELVTIDPDAGVLRLGKTITTSQDNLREISLALEGVLVCYVSGQPKEDSQCKNIHRRIEALFIEGHTDNVPLGRKLMLQTGLKDNRELSTIRSVHTYNQMIKYAPKLATFKNEDGWPVISVSGYGSDRPVKGHEWDYQRSDPVNRRIDIRIIMTPFTPEDVESLL